VTTRLAREGPRRGDARGHVRELVAQTWKPVSGLAEGLALAA
jgi:hypothetical protein